jgi:membrane protein DedA with SNARE-associated domain
VPVPGEAATLVAGFLASPAGGHRFNLAVVIMLAFSAAILGDNAGFWIGRRFARPRLERGQSLLVLSPQAMRTVDGYFNRYGTWTVFFARFITGLRVVVSLAAGAAAMSWPRFLLANAAGALVWASTVSLLGYFFGRSWQLLHHWLSGASWIVLAAVLVIAACLYIRARVRCDQSPRRRELINQHALLHLRKV